MDPAGAERGNMVPSKLGYSEQGGIFYAKNITSDFHKHNCLAVIVSIDRFNISTASIVSPKVINAALINQNITYKIETLSNGIIYFLHIDNITTNGILRLKNDIDIQEVDTAYLREQIQLLDNWLISNDNTVSQTQEIINGVISMLLTHYCFYQEVDDRVKNCIKIIKTNDNEDNIFKDIKVNIGLSQSRLAHLFKKETGITISQYIISEKLRKSLQSVYHDNSLTESALLGGFYDHPHFTKTFKKYFGIQPFKAKR